MTAATANSASYPAATRDTGPAPRPAATTNRAGANPGPGPGRRGPDAWVQYEYGVHAPGMAAPVTQISRYSAEQIVGFVPNGRLMRRRKTPTAGPRALPSWERWEEVNTTPFRAETPSPQP